MGAVLLVVVAGFILSRTPLAPYIGLNRNAGLL
jgi:hypothetical protein